MSLTQAAYSLSRIVFPVSRIFNGIGVSMMAAMMLLVAADTTLRYLFNRPIIGSYELIELLMPILVGLGLAYTAVFKEHIRVDFIISRFSPKVQAFVDSITTLTGIGFLSLITWGGILHAESLRTSGYITTALQIPIYPFVWVLVVGSAIFCLVLIVDLLNHLAQVLAKGSWRLQAGLLFGIALISLLFAIPILGRGMLPDLSPITVAFFGICLLIVLLFLGMHIGIAMGLTGFLGMAYVAGLGSGLSIMMTTPYNTIASHTFSVIPLFILMGAFCFYSGISRDFYFTMHRFVGHLPGGLAMATVGGCAGFAAVSGSAVAAAATMSTVALPEMQRYKYDPALATGCVAAGGTLGVLIPPSVLFVIYGIVTEQSIGKLFLAGFIPGILQALFYIVAIYILCKRNPHMGPRGARTNFTQKLASLQGTWGILVLFLLVIGGIYMGVFTPSEAAGVGAFGAFLITLGKRKLNWKTFTASLVDSGKTTSMCLFMLIGAMLFGYFMSVTRFPVELANVIAELSVNGYIVLGAIIIIFLVAGCVGGDMPMMIITAPIFVPMLVALGFNPIWFGVIMVRLLEIGGITPPIGLQVYVIKGIAKDIPMATIFRGIVPFLIADFCELALLIAFPILSLFLPGLMK